MNNKVLMRRFDAHKIAIVGIMGALTIVLGSTPLGFIPIGVTGATTMHIPVITSSILFGPAVGSLVGLIFGVFSMMKGILNPTPFSFVVLNPLVSVIPRILIGIFPYYIYSYLNHVGLKKAKIALSIFWLAILGYLGHGIFAAIQAGNTMSIWVNSGLFILVAAMALLEFSKLADSYQASLDKVIAAIVGTLTNTVGFLGGVYLFYGERYVSLMGVDPANAGKTILGIGIVNGIPECIIAIILVMAITKALGRK